MEGTLYSIKQLKKKQADETTNHTISSLAMETVTTSRVRVHSILHHVTPP